MRSVLALALVFVASCYTGAPAARDVSASWVGRTRIDISDRWGAPATDGHVCLAPAPDSGCGDGGSVLQWSYSTRHIDLPDVFVGLRVQPGDTDFTAALKPGRIWTTSTEAGALVDVTGHILRVDGASLHWGPPNDANLHWGTVLGIHTGMGRLDTTPTPLPSGNLYIGGMLGPTLGLVGTYALVSGTSNMGGAMAMAGGIGVQWWPINRLWLRGGPALVLGFDPGFANAALRPGLDVGASYAVIKVGRLAVDVALDVTVATDRTFGLVGVGVNVN